MYFRECKLSWKARLIELLKTTWTFYVDCNAQSTDIQSCFVCETFLVCCSNSFWKRRALEWVSLSLSTRIQLVAWNVSWPLRKGGGAIVGALSQCGVQIRSGSLRDTTVTAGCSGFGLACKKPQDPITVWVFQLWCQAKVKVQGCLEASACRWSADILTVLPC